MRKLFLIASLVIVATSAHASQTRGLLTAAPHTQTAQLQAEEPKASVADQLKAIGETPKPAAVEPVSAPAPAPVAAAPAAAAPARVAAAPAASQSPHADARAEAAPVKKQAKKAKVRRETDEQKARRIAGRYGISW